MKTHPAISLVVLTLSTLACAAEKEKPAMPTTNPTAIAVVELFTSQGCSSCPPADALLADLLNDARANQKPIYFLAFHVDYWDRLGWRDPFSDAAYSNRQRAYARAFHNDSIYTPQMIINGQSEFVGSDRRRATTEIAAALARPAPVTLKLTIVPDKSPDTLTITCDLNPLTKNAHLNIAVVERALETKVLRGENASRTLKHENVVRAFQAQNLEKPQARAELTLPQDLNRQNASVIAYVQDDAMHTLGATALSLPQK